MWVYLLGAFFLLPCAATAEDGSCPGLDEDGYYTFNVVGQDLKKVKNCLREYLTNRLQSGEDLRHINIDTIITPKIDDRSTTSTSEQTAEVTTTPSITSTFGTEVPSSTTVHFSPTMTGTTQSQEATPPSATVVSVPTESEPSEQPGTNPSGVLSSLNVTVHYDVPSCPPYCNSTNETSYISHTWCVVQSQCNCEGSILELKKSSTKTAHDCMKPLQKDCPSTCEFYVKNPQFFNFSTVISRIYAFGLMNVICECGNSSGSGLPSTYGWVIIQRGLRNGTNKSSTMVDYENRNWKPHFWHGLKHIYQLTSDNASLQIEFEKIDSTGAKKYFFVRYSHFSIGDNSTNYRLNVIEQPHCGSDTKRLPDYLDPKSVHPVFTEKDDSGWWFYDSNGLGFNLNAKWNNGIRWGNETYDTVVMKIRPGGAEKVLCVNLTERFLISGCPQSCSTTNSSGHEWCVRDSCICDDLHVRLKDNTHACCKAEDCVVPVADNCTQICERALADGSKLIPGQPNAFSPDGTFTARIIDGGPKQVQCNCMNGTRTGMLETNGWVIVQRRLDLDANFSRALSDYQRGFTDSEDFWIGLRSLHEMTKTRSNGAFLQIELGKLENGTMMLHYIRYRRFYVSRQERNFSLAVEFDSMKASTAHDALDSENEIPIFSMNGSSGWWFTGDPTNLNGKSGILWGNVTYDIARMLILPQYDEAENCTYVNCSRISTTNHTFCIDEYCKCDRSWLLRLMTDKSYRPDWDKTCKVPVGDNCVDACRIWSRLKITTSPNRVNAYIKIYGKYEKVYCDCSENDPGWLVIWQKRDGDGGLTGYTFNDGLNDAKGYYWIGFNLIGRLTDQYSANLLMTLNERKDNNGKNHTIKYQSFFKNNAAVFGEDPSAVNSSNLVPSNLQKFQMNNKHENGQWGFKYEHGGSFGSFSGSFGRNLSHGYDVMEMKIMTGQVLCPVEYEGKCFLPFTELTYKCDGTDGTVLCKSIGGHLANIYSQPHMDDVAKFVRDHRMRHNGVMHFQLGMTYTKNGKLLLLHNGTAANVDCKTCNNAPPKFVILSVTKYIYNNAVSITTSANANSNNWSNVLCEIEKP